ncbi:hypothetical protein JCM10213_003705 [Rhodosporidiobolus nylandii]
MEIGVKATRDSCSADITHTVHVRCAERVDGEDRMEGRLTCPDFDLCVDCFLHGKSLGPHRPTHAYRIISSHSFPIFTRDWGADEELALIEGAQIYGLGNWADIAEHMGGRTKEDCAEHYRRIYLESEEYPLPNIDPVSPTDIDAFPSRKAARLHELQSRPLPMPPPKPMASTPTCHELGGYVPGRHEFEHEWENEAEMLIKDMEFGRVYHLGGETRPAAPPAPPAEGEAPAEEEEPLPDGQNEGDEPEEELELKMAVLEMFNERYDKRMSAKEMIFDRGLINYKPGFVDGLLYEVALRKGIAELQSYRRAGITTLAEAERYEQAKQQRLSSKAAYRDTLALSFGASTGPRRPNPAAQITANLRNRPPPPLTLATAGSLQLLTPLEQCSSASQCLSKAAWARGRRGGRLLREKNGELLGPEEGAQGEWGEKIERVWESVRDLSGLRESEGESEEDGEGDEEMKDAAGAAAGTPMQLEA